MVAGECQTKNMNEYDPDEQEETPPELDAGDIELLKTYGNGPYTLKIKDCEDEIKKHEKKVKELIGIKDSDTGLCIPSQWDLVADKQAIQEEQPLQVARCTKIIDESGTGEDCKYVINVKQIAKFVVGYELRVSYLRGLGVCGGLRRFRAIFMNRLRERRRWVVSFPILRPFLTETVPSAHRRASSTRCSAIRNEVRGWWNWVLVWAP